MSERFTRLFSLPERLYTKGAPIIISAGALLKDSQSGKVLAQLKYQRISEKPIKALTVSLVPFDITGKQLGDEIEYQYLDLTAERGTDFGQKTPIYLPDNATRSFSVTVKEVIFSDNEVWHNSADIWQSLPVPVAVSDAISSHELAGQYKLDNGFDAMYMPDKMGDLWYCTCGKLNHADEAKCYGCGRELSTQKIAVSLDVLQTHYNERAAKEAEEKTEKECIAAKKRAKVKKIATMSAVAAMIVVAVVAVIKVGIPSWKYNQAMKLFENGEYEAAVSAFEAMGDYKDAPEQAKEAELLPLYLEAERLFECEEYEEAATKFAQLGNFKDSKERKEEAKYEVYRSAVQKILIQEFQALGVAQYTIAAGRHHTVGLKSDGTVVAVGNNKYGQCEVGDWTDIIAVAASSNRTAGLKWDGTVVFCGEKGRNDGLDWQGVVKRRNSSDFQLNSDGTVTATGVNIYGRNNVDDWTDIVSLVAKSDRAVGLKSDGTVVVSGNNGGQRAVNDWTDIVTIAAGMYHTVGLKSDGTVVATGSNSDGQCEVGSWTDIKVPESGR